MAKLLIYPINMDVNLAVKPIICQGSLETTKIR